MCLAAVTKFSRYDESSDSDESDTSESESSTTDDDNRSVSPKSVSPPRDAANDDRLSTSNHSSRGNEASASICEHSSTRQLTVAETSKPAERTDLPTDDDKSRCRSASPKSDNSTLSSVGTTPSPISAPLQLESTEYSKLYRDEHRKDVPSNRRREQANARRLPLRHRELSPSSSRHSLQPAVKGERSPLRTSNVFPYRLAKNSASTSDLKPLSHTVSEQLSPHRHFADENSRFQSRSSEQSSEGRYDSRSYTSERQPPSPPGFRNDNIPDRSRLNVGPDKFPKSRSYSRSPSVGKSPRRTSSRGFSPRQQRLRSTEKDLPRAPRSRSSSRSYHRSSSKSRSRSRGRFVGSSAAQSLSHSRSQLPVRRSPYRRRTRSRSASRDDERFVPRLDSEVASRSSDKSPSRYLPAGPYQVASQRQTSRSLSTERTLPVRDAERVVPQVTTASGRLSANSSPPRRSFSRSPDRTDTKSLSRQESPLSDSRPSSLHRSPISRLSDRKSPHRHSPAARREKNKRTDDRQDSEKYRFERSVAKPEDRTLKRSQPEVRRGRLGPLMSSVRTHNLASRGSPGEGLGRSRQRTNEVLHCNVRKRYSPSLPDSESAKRKTDSQYSTERRYLDRRKEKLTDSLVPKPFVKAEVLRSRRDDTQLAAVSECRQNLTDLPSKQQKIFAGDEEDSGVVEKLKKLAEPDKFVHRNEDAVTKSRDNSTKKHSRWQKAPSLPAKNYSAYAESEKTDAHRALTLKRPAAPVAAVLEARKRRFEQTQDADSRSVCIRSSSAAEAESCAKLRRKLSPVRYDKMKQLNKDVKEGVTAAVTDKPDVHSKTEESGTEKTYGKMQTDASVSDISDPSSADTSMSLEDISEDETPRDRDKHFVERSAFSSTQRRPGLDSKVRNQQRSEREDATSGKTSAVSSVVRPVKRDGGVSDAHRPLKTVTQRRQPASEAEYGVDDSPTADDGVAVRAAVQNVSKGSHFDILTLVFPGATGSASSHVVFSPLVLEENTLNKRRGIFTDPMSYLSSNQ